MKSIYFFVFVFFVMLFRYESWWLYVPELYKANVLAQSGPVAASRLATPTRIQYKFVSGVVYFHKSAFELPIVVSIIAILALDT